MSKSKSMGKKEFAAALVSLGACQEARRRLRSKTLRKFWQGTRRADWMLWLAIRCGLWHKVKPVVRDNLANYDLQDISQELSRRNRNAAANGTCFLPRCPDLAADIRARVPWHMVVDAVRAQVARERKS